MKIKINTTENENLDEIAKQWVEIVLSQIKENKHQKTSKLTNKNPRPRSYE